MIAEEKPDFPKTVIVNNFESLSNWEEWQNTPEVIAIRQDVNTTWPKYGRESIWEGGVPAAIEFQRQHDQLFPGRQTGRQESPHT
jgi:hypothetical protein